MPVERHITLSELAAEIRAVVESSFRQKTYWVIADVIDHKAYAQNGSHYFKLVEKDSANNTVKAKMDAVAWGDGGAVSISSFEKITGQKFKSDINVLVNVSVNYHQAYGLQLVLNDIDTTYTIGVLEQQRRLTLQTLLQKCHDFIRFDGSRYHTRNNELPHSRVIHRIAVVTSSTAAGYKDFRDTIEKNKHGYKIDIHDYFVTVQGEANADAIVNRLIEIYHADSSGTKYDAVVIIRGGGSQADLLIFEQYALARAVAKFPIPIITGIGHHINETICDLMATTPVKTPSIAAEYIISHNKTFEESILNFQKTIIIKSQQLFATRQGHLHQLNLAIINNTRRIIQVSKESILQQCQATINGSRVLLFKQRIHLNDESSRTITRPRIIMGTRAAELSNIVQNIKAHTDRYLINMGGYLRHYESMRKAHDPINVLKRGFAVIIHKGKVITSAEGLQPHDEVKIRMSQSEITTTVKSKTPKDGQDLDI
jgi:exodeoxyribonuclease VII large subunit